jgi:hypothetical protein
MAPVLDDLPNELFENIVQRLDLSDIYNLRSSSRLLASKATQHHFKSFFRMKQVALDERSLKYFAHATQPAGCLVEELVLVGPQAGLESLFLDDLFETCTCRHLWFDGAGRRKYGCDDVFGCSTVERQGEAVRLPISYFFLDRGQIGDSADGYNLWKQWHGFEYEA